jgi:hypothetical protein
VKKSSGVMYPLLSLSANFAIMGPDRATLAITLLLLCAARAMCGGSASDGTVSVLTELDVVAGVAGVAGVVGLGHSLGTALGASEDNAEVAWSVPLILVSAPSMPKRFSSRMNCAMVKRDCASAPK